MPKIPHQFTQAVFYIYPSQDDAENNTEYGATGFFFGIESKLLDGMYYYAVTNAHVVFQEGMESPVIRVNTNENKFHFIKTSQSNWIRHFDGDDIAICPIDIDSDEITGGAFTKEFIATEEFLREYSVGAGDDVFMVGRFRVHSGSSRNLPVVRFGNIAAMNDEGLYNDATKLRQESYLVEMRSIAGFSGSPVIIYINPLMSVRSSDAPAVSMGTLGRLEIKVQIKLLGIQWGQISYKTRAEDEFGQKYKMNVDSAMEGVIPIQKLMDLIDSDEMVEMRKKSDKKNIQQRNVDITL